MNPSTVAAMPKVELHVHIEGTIEPSLVRSLAERNGLQVPSSIKGDTEGYDFHDLESLLKLYNGNMDVLRTAQDFHDLCWAYLSKCKTQNIIHTEIFFDAQAHTGRGVGFSEVIEGLHEAVVRADKELGVSALLIMCFVREKDAESAMATLEEAKPYKDWIVGVGLDSEERDNPPNKFAAVFKSAREQGYKLTCHCGIDEPNSIEHIRQAIEDIGVDRIDHGLKILEDSKLVDAVVDRKIGLTCCPVSNSVVGNDLYGEATIELLRRGALITLNSDDPAYFRAYLNENITRLTYASNLRRSDIVKMQRNALNISWLSSEKYTRLMGTFNQWIISIELAG